MSMTLLHPTFVFFPLHATVVVSSRAIVPVFVVCDMSKAEEGTSRVLSTVATILYWHKLLWILDGAPEFSKQSERVRIKAGQ